MNEKRLAVVKHAW
jgi:Ca2+-binding EF-hand superfamily protein